MQEVSGVYTSPLLNTVERKMALRARKVSGLSRNGPQGTEQTTVERSIHPKLIKGKLSIKYCLFNMFKLTVNPFDQAD